MRNSISSIGKFSDRPSTKSKSIERKSILSLGRSKMTDKTSKKKTSVMSKVNPKIYKSSMANEKPMLKPSSILRKKETRLKATSKMRVKEKTSRK